MTRRAVIAVLMLSLAVGLSACGRKGKLVPPEGSTYPRHYPNVTFPDGKNGPPASPQAPTPQAPTEEE